MQLVDEIWSGIQASVTALGFDVWGVELSGGRQYKTLRIYIDSTNGVSVDDCAQVSGQVGAILDVEEWITTEYSLEVSSPGMDRCFFRSPQLLDYVGQQLSVRLKQPREGRSRFTGQLLAVDGNQIELSVEGESLSFAFDATVKVRLIPDAY